MVKTPRDVTEAELSVLQVLWQQGPATIRAITNNSNPTGLTRITPPSKNCLNAWKQRVSSNGNRRESPLCMKLVSRVTNWWGDACRRWRRRCVKDR